MSSRRSCCFWTASSSLITPWIRSAKSWTRRWTWFPRAKAAALVGEAGSSRVELAVASGDVGGPPLQICQLDQSGLVEVDQPTLFVICGVDLAVQAGKFGGEQLVVGDRCSEGDGMFTGKQQLWLQQRCLT